MRIIVTISCLLSAAALLLVRGIKFCRVTTKGCMALSEDLQLKLRKRFEPSAVVSMRYKGNDVSIKTDEEGNAVVLFIGNKNHSGKITGTRYTRTFKRDNAGVVIKDHWDLKGKAS